MAKKNRQTITHIIKSLTKGSTVSQACKNAGISTFTFYSWCRYDKRFNDMVENAKESRIKIVEDALLKSAKAGVTQAQIFYLKNRAKDKWSDTVEHKGNIDFNIIEEMKLARERMAEYRASVN